MSRARQRRSRARKNYLARLALTDPAELDVALRHRIESWAKGIRRRAKILSAGSAHEMADEIADQMRELASAAPDAAQDAADVGEAMHHIATTEIARAVEPRMVRLGIWPLKSPQ